MLAYRIELTITQDKTLTLENLPFHSGTQVEVIILSCPYKVSITNSYPLRGMPIQYLAPTDPVALENWEAMS